MVIKYRHWHHHHYDDQYQHQQQLQRLGSSSLVSPTTALIIILPTVALWQRPAEVGAFVRTAVERFPELQETHQGEALAMLLLHAHASGELRAV
jgi:hypothetical protein